MVSKAKGKVHDCDNAIAVHFFNKLCSDQPCPKLSTVRRNLFGYYNQKSKSSSCQLLDEQISDLAKKSSREWNFDFLNELPQTGRYMWQRVRSYEVPAWYAAMSRPTFKDLRENVMDAVESTSEDSCQLSQSETRCRFTGLGESKTELASSKKLRLVQTTMKDFTRVKKRRCSHRLRLKQVQIYSNRLRNHHNLSVHSRAVVI